MALVALMAPMALMVLVALMVPVAPTVPMALMAQSCTFMILSQPSLEFLETLEVL